MNGRMSSKERAYLVFEQAQTVPAQIDWYTAGQRGRITSYNVCYTKLLRCDMVFPIMSISSAVFVQRCCYSSSAPSRK